MMVHLVGNPGDDAPGVPDCGVGATIVARNPFSLPYITPAHKFLVYTFDAQK